MDCPKHEEESIDMNYETYVEGDRELKFGYYECPECGYAVDDEGDEEEYIKDGEI